MSDKFIECRIWKSHRNDNNTLLETSITENELQTIVGNKSFALVASRGVSGDKNWNKYMLECTINMLKDMADSTSPNIKSHDNPRLTEHDIDVEMLNQLRYMTNALQYMINCKSWSDGEYHRFDANEISNRLITASNMR